MTTAVLDRLRSAHSGRFDVDKYRRPALALRRSDQAVTWPRTMLQPATAVVIDCETTNLPGAIGGKVGI